MSSTALRDIPIFSEVNGCPLDAIMTDEGVHRWMAIALYLSDNGMSFYAIGRSLGHSAQYVRNVAKGMQSNLIVSDAIAKACGLPESQVFPAPRSRQ